MENCGRASVPWVNRCCATRTSKRDLRSALIDTSAWEDITNHRDTWWQSVKVGVSKAEANARVQATCKKAARKERPASAHVSTRHVCGTCKGDCHSRIGLHSHTRSCPYVVLHILHKCGLTHSNTHQVGTIYLIIYKVLISIRLVRSCDMKLPVLVTSLPNFCCVS